MGQGPQTAYRSSSCVARNLEVFRNKGSMNELRQQIKEIVAKLYPISDSAKLKPTKEQESRIPDDLVDLMQPSSSERKTRTVQLIREKNSTPSDGGPATSSCVWHNRPHRVAAGVSTGAIEDPSSAKMRAD